MIAQIRAMIQGRRDEGASAVEYGLLIAGIAVVVLVAVWALGSTVSGSFEEVNTTIVDGPPADEGEGGE